MKTTFLLLCLLLPMLSCKSDKSTVEMNANSELVFSEDICLMINTKSNLNYIKTLVLDTKVTCEDLRKLCDLSFFQNLEYLLFYNLECKEIPDNFTMLTKLEKLIVNSSDLDHLPTEILSLPSLKHLQFDVMDYQTYEGEIPASCKIEEIEFQSTPVKDLGNLVNISTLKSVGIEDPSSLNNTNENINLVVH